MKTNTTMQNVINAVNAVNAEQNYQIEFKRLEYAGKKVLFTLKSKSKIPGSRISYSGRNLPAASWHAHGFIFEEIFKLDPTCYIETMGKKLFAGFSWEDKNIGSRLSPCYFSETSIL